MTAVGDMGILITTGGNKQEAVPVASPSVGNKGMNLSIGGKPLAVSSSTPDRWRQGLADQYRRGETVCT